MAARGVAEAGASRNAYCPPWYSPYPIMSPESFTSTAYVSVHAGPSTAPRSVAWPDDDHSTASVPLAVSENPTLHPEALMAEASSKW